MLRLSAVGSAMTGGDFMSDLFNKLAMRRKGEQSYTCHIYCTGTVSLLSLRYTMLSVPVFRDLWEGSSRWGVRWSPQWDRECFCQNVRRYPATPRPTGPRRRRWLGGIAQRIIGCFSLKNSLFLNRTIKKYIKPFSVLKEFSQPLYHENNNCKECN